MFLKKLNLRFKRLIEEKGPPNRKQYKVAVYFMRKRIDEGIGKSIHESEVVNNNRVSYKLDYLKEFKRSSRNYYN